MTDSMALALLALAMGDSLPVPAYPVDGGPAVWTVAAVMADSVAYAAHGLEAVIQTPGPGQTLVLLWLPDATGVEELPPSLPDAPGTGCGRIFSWR